MVKALTPPLRAGSSRSDVYVEEALRVSFIGSRKRASPLDLSGPEAIKAFLACHARFAPNASQQISGASGIGSMSQ